MTNSVPPRLGSEVIKLKNCWSGFSVLFFALALGLRILAAARPLDSRASRVPRVRQGLGGAPLSGFFSRLLFPFLFDRRCQLEFAAHGGMDEGDVRDSVEQSGGVAHLRGLRNRAVWVLGRWPILGCGLGEI